MIEKREDPALVLPPTKAELLIEGARKYDLCGMLETISRRYFSKYPDELTDDEADHVQSVIVPIFSYFEKYVASNRRLN